MSMLNIGASSVDGSFSELTGIQEGDVQPNAVDLRLGKVFKINTTDFLIDETQKVHRGSVEVQPQSDGYYHLAPGSYEVIMENEINVAGGEAGFVITRSTLNRNGVFLTSGLYDSGYNGVMAGVMHVNVSKMLIKPGTRVGQYLSWKAQSVSMYDGDYGKGKEHDKKYEG
jgi:deoxycytidine triphosphate deaminase